MGRYSKNEVFEKNDWNILALAQHHGLPTRLLDWNDNILKAAYFTVRGNITVDGCIWALNAPKQTPLKWTNNKNPLEIKKDEEE